MECPRKYYWHYYGSHNGWEEDSSPEAQLAYRLKQLSNLYLFLGSVIHDLAARAILDARGGKKPHSADQLVAEGRRRLNQAYRESQRIADWERSPKWRTMFHEFYYSTGPSTKQVEVIRQRLVICVNSLLNSQSYLEALEAPFVEVKDVDRPMTTFMLDDYTIYAQPDVLYRVGTGEIRIVDWKTGDEGELHARQLRIYGLYVRARKDIEPGPLVGILEYLQTGQRESVAISEGDLADQERQTRESIAAMQRYLANPAENQPLPRAGFPLASDQSICRYCNFYKLNKTELESETSSGPF